MQEEELRGPIELTEKTETDRLSDDGGNEEGNFAFFSIWYEYISLLTILVTNYSLLKQ